MTNQEQFIKYTEILGQIESSNNYGVQNRLDYSGKYQFGGSILQDIGMLSDSKGNNWEYNDQYWTGKYGVNSIEEFLNNPNAQEQALIDSVQVQWNYAKHYDLDQYIGQTIGGVEITKSGLIAAIHNQGAGTVKQFLETGNMTYDGNETPVTKYLKEVGGLEFDTDKIEPIELEEQTDIDILMDLDEQNQDLISEDFGDENLLAANEYTNNATTNQTSDITDNFRSVNANFQDNQYNIQITLNKDGTSKIQQYRSVYANFINGIALKRII